jgi:hypothetical protein
LKGLQKRKYVSFASAVAQNNIAGHSNFLWENRPFAESKHLHITAPKLTRVIMLVISTNVQTFIATG